MSYSVPIKLEAEKLKLLKYDGGYFSPQLIFFTSN